MSKTKHIHVIEGTIKIAIAFDIDNLETALQAQSGIQQFAHFRQLLPLQGHTLQGVVIESQAVQRCFQLNGAKRLIVSDAGH